MSDTRDGRKDNKKRPRAQQSVTPSKGSPYMSPPGAKKWAAAAAKFNKLPKIPRNTESKPPPSLNVHVADFTRYNGFSSVSFDIASSTHHSPSPNTALQVSSSDWLGFFGSTREGDLSERHKESSFCSTGDAMPKVSTLPYPPAALHQISELRKYFHIAKQTALFMSSINAAKCSSYSHMLSTPHVARWISSGIATRVAYFSEIYSTVLVPIWKEAEMDIERLQSRIIASGRDEVSVIAGAVSMTETIMDRCQSSVRSIFNSFYGSRNVHFMHGVPGCGKHMWIRWMESILSSDVKLLKHYVSSSTTDVSPSSNIAHFSGDDLVPTVSVSNLPFKRGAVADIQPYSNVIMTWSFGQLESVSAENIELSLVKFIDGMCSAMPAAYNLCGSLCIGIIENIDAIFSCEHLQAADLTKIMDVLMTHIRNRLLQPTSFVRPLLYITCSSTESYQIRLLRRTLKSNFSSVRNDTWPFLKHPSLAEREYWLFNLLRKDKGANIPHGFHPYFLKGFEKIIELLTSRITDAELNAKLKHCFHAVRGNASISDETPMLLWLAHVNFELVVIPSLTQTNNAFVVSIPSKTPPYLHRFLTGQFHAPSFIPTLVARSNGASLSLHNRNLICDRLVNNMNVPQLMLRLPHAVIISLVPKVKGGSSSSSSSHVDHNNESDGFEYILDIYKHVESFCNTVALHASWETLHMRMSLAEETIASQYCAMGLDCIFSSKPLPNGTRLDYTHRGIFRDPSTVGARPTDDFAGVEEYIGRQDSSTSTLLNRHFWRSPDATLEMLAQYQSSSSTKSLISSLERFDLSSFGGLLS